MAEQGEGYGKPRNADRVQLQDQLKEHLDSLLATRIGHLADEDVEKLQLRLDVLERWAALNESAIGDMYDDDDTNLHHHHHIE